MFPKKKLKGVIKLESRMKTDYSDFNYFDFHDSYFEKVEVDGECLVWYLEAVNVLPECRMNPHSCSMMASELRIEFVNCKVLTFKNVLFEWEKYEAKAWYVYEKERENEKYQIDICLQG